MHYVAYAHFTSSPVIGGLIAFALPVAYVVSWVRDLRRHPLVPCPSCGGTGRHFSQWNPAASGPCRGPCRGKGFVRRRGAPVE